MNKAPFDKINKNEKVNDYTFKKPNRSVNSVYVHCSASDNIKHDNIETIKKWHIEDRGWSNIGYHLFINKQGQIFEGRPLEKIPAAQRGYNTGSIAICVSGLKKENFTKEQFESLYSLCCDINKEYNGDVRFIPHNAVSNKSCPVFSIREVLGIDSDNKMVFDSKPGYRTIEITCTPGEDVKYLQKILGLTQDGLFGRQTSKALKLYQEEHGLENDGICGHLTWDFILEKN
jgi:N-acetylmuramoyl-L-alanine amidase